MGDLQSMRTVYVETTVVGHLIGTIHSEPIIAARQTVTRNRWTMAQQDYRLVIPELVTDECASGDREMAKDRLAAIGMLDQVEMSDEVTSLAEKLMSARAVPPTEPRDALHISLAAVNGVEYLVTWNFKHIANANVRGLIEQTCRDAGYAPPVICTPDELMGE
jgi:hypothetical protein